MRPPLEPTAFSERLEEALANRCADKDPFAELLADVEEVYRIGGAFPKDRVLALVRALETMVKQLDETREMHRQMCDLSKARYTLLQQTKTALVEFDAPLASAVSLAEHHPGTHAQAFETREKALKAQNTRHQLLQAIKAGVAL